MNQMTVYTCEHCDFSTTDKQECLAHEANHYGLTPEEYAQWRQLFKDASHAGIILGITRTPKTVADFELIIHKLVAFEIEHHIESSKLPRPKHFY